MRTDERQMEQMACLPETSHKMVLQIVYYKSASPVQQHKHRMIKPEATETFTEHLETSGDHVDCRQIQNCEVKKNPG